MGILENYKITLNQINNMKHAIGFDKRKIKGTKYRKFESCRNFFTTQEGCKDFEELEELSNQGLMLSRQMGDKWCFHVSKEGMRFLENITAVAIIELDDSL